MIMIMMILMIMVIIIMILIYVQCPVVTGAIPRITVPVHIDTWGTVDSDNDYDDYNNHKYNDIMI